MQSASRDARANDDDHSRPGIIPTTSCHCLSRASRLRLVYAQASGLPADRRSPDHSVDLIDVRRGKCRRRQHHSRPSSTQEARVWQLTPTEPRQQLTRPCLTSSLQPLTWSHPSLSRRDLSGLPRGDVFYFADTGQLEVRLNGCRPCTQPNAADADCITEIVTHRTPDACAANPGCLFLEMKAIAGKEAVMVRSTGSRATQRPFE
jgi:hypothetical protein